MRTLLVMMLLVSNANAVWIKTNIIGDCEAVQSTNVLESQCGADCVEIDNGYDCRYYEMIDGVLTINTVNKSIVDTEIQDRIVKDNLIATETKDMRNGEVIHALIKIKNKTKGLTKPERLAIREAQKDILSLLREGYLCDAREGISSITPTAIITSQDINDIVGEIDKVKECN